MHEIIATSAYLRVQLSEMELALKKQIRNCVDCDYFQAGIYYCMLYKAKVPANIIMIGCEEFKNDVPF